ncbi:MAG: hypothetical protein WCP15_02410 [bacterium]
MKKIVIIAIGLAFIFAVYLMRPSQGTSISVATVTEVSTVQVESEQTTENNQEALTANQQGSRDVEQTLTNENAPKFGSNILRFNCRVEIQ